MSPRIVHIEHAGRDRHARRLVFDDGSEPRLTSAAAVRELGAQVGAIVDRDSLESALSELEPLLAREKALRLLGHRDRSTDELLRRLTDGGYPEAVSRQVVTHLAELDIIDDERFAAAWTRSRVARGLGSARIRAELREKGLPAHAIDSVLASECADEDEVGRAVASLRGQAPHDPKDRARSIRRLVARGYRIDVAVDAINRVVQDCSTCTDLDDFPC